MTLTDYGLTVLCSWFAWSLQAQNTHARCLQMLWIFFFASIAVASLTGGTVHGFFLEESSWGYRILWPVTLLGIGITAATAWVLSGLLTKQSKTESWIWFAVMTFAAYALVVIFYSQRFVIAILNYAPAMIALLIVGIRDYLQVRVTSFLWVSGGILISFIAAFIQQIGISIHPDYFNYNATYHLVQAVGLWVLFKGAKGLLRTERITR